MRAVALLVLVTLVGCRSLPADPAEVGLSESATLLAVEPVQQHARADCGPTCLQALLQYHGVAPDSALGERFPRAAIEGDGVQAGALRDALRARGFRAVLVRGSLDHTTPAGILALLDRGLPLIVEFVFPDDRRHFVLLAGYDPERRGVLIMDPAHGGFGLVPYGRFQQLWCAADHLTLIAAPHPTP